MNQAIIIAENTLALVLYFAVPLGIALGVGLELIGLLHLTDRIIK